MCMYFVRGLIFIFLLQLRYLFENHNYDEFCNLRLGCLLIIGLLEFAIKLMFKFVPILGLWLLKLWLEAALLKVLLLLLSIFMDLRETIL